MVMLVQRRFRSFSNHVAFHGAMIALVCVVMVLLSGSSPASPAGADGATRPMDDRIEQIEAPHHTAVPMARFDIRVAEDLPEPTDEYESKTCLPRLAVAALGSQAAFYESPADRVLTRFQLRAFSTRGSPLA